MWPNADQTQELLAQVQSGNDEAINRLLERHRQAVRHMIDLRMDQVLKRRLDASDIVQEVMIEANRRINQYLENPLMPFHLWLRQMAKDRLIDATADIDRRRGGAWIASSRSRPPPRVAISRLLTWRPNSATSS